MGPQDDVRNYTLSQYEAFITKKFSPFGQQIPYQLLEFYNFTYINGEPQLSYDTIAADIHATCGQIYLAGLMSRKIPVYHYIATYRYSYPVSFGNWQARYSFHQIEYLAFLGFLPEPQPRDAQFGTSVRKLWLQFILTGQFSSSNWPQFYQQLTDSSYNSLILDAPLSFQKNFRVEQCEFLNSNGFYPYNWNS